jgi:hypothetical protein
MAIFSLHHSFVGRSTHPAGAASAYARYMTRNETCTVILGERMPLDKQVYAWLDDQEKNDRKNARVVDRVVVALPSELSREQNIELLQAYGERLTEGRASWMAAIHDGPGDIDNPHAHIIFRDRDIETGRRVMLTSEAGSTQRLRQAWEEEVNLALERAGRDERVDRRSLADQGIDREPQLHVGPAAQRLAERQHEFESNAKQITRLIAGKPSEVTVNYPVIDEGRTRYEENEERKLRNWVRAQEELAMNGPVRPELTPTERAAQAGFRLDARYREAVRSGEVPTEDGDPITTVIREQMAAREEARGGQGKTYVPMTYGESLLPPMPTQVSRSDPSIETKEEINRRKDEYEKLKETPGMEQVLRARDYLNALSFERGKPRRPARIYLSIFRGQRATGYRYRQRSLEKPESIPKSPMSLSSTSRTSGRPSATWLICWAAAVLRWLARLPTPSKLFLMSRPSSKPENMRISWPNSARSSRSPNSSSASSKPRRRRRARSSSNYSARSATASGIMIGDGSHAIEAPARSGPPTRSSDLTGSPSLREARESPPGQGNRST